MSGEMDAHRLVLGYGVYHIVGRAKLCEGYL